jgi:hypothetical protein
MYLCSFNRVTLRRKNGSNVTSGLNLKIKVQGGQRLSKVLKWIHNRLLKKISKDPKELKGEVQALALKRTEISLIAFSEQDLRQVLHLRSLKLRQLGK